ncbi:MAG: biotin--[acetyl-CoA-carboxylase] ligase [Bacteroidia bacterium]
METLFIGQKTIFLPETDSTNSYAIQLLKGVNVEEGTIVYASNQIEGRGQRGNSWESEPGLNLALSIILKPNFLDKSKLYFLYILSSLAVHDLLSEILDKSQFDIKIKWPNDLMVNNRKICGILIENQLQNESIKYAVCGIGINVNQEKFKDKIRAISLRNLTGNEYNLNTLLKKLSAHFEKYYLKLRSGRLEELKAIYLNNLYKYNKEQEFIINSKHTTFFVAGINDSGLLHLKDKDNKDFYFDVKEIKWV